MVKQVIIPPLPIRGRTFLYTNLQLDKRHVIIHGKGLLSFAQLTRALHGQIFFAENGLHRIGVEINRHVISMIPINEWH